MKVFVATDFRGVWPTGTAAVVVAETPERAHALLAAALRERGLAPPEAFEFREVELTTEQALVLDDGDY